MDEFKLGQKVIINQTKKTGTIISIWTSIGGQTQYQVRYFDNNDLASNFWFFATDISFTN